MAEVQTAPGSKPRFSRILLKLSGEAFAPPQGSGLDPDALAQIALDVKDVLSLGRARQSAERGWLVNQTALRLVEEVPLVSMAPPGTW